MFADTWKALDQVDLQAYMGLLILSGVHRSNNEATKSLWDAESGRPISTMSLQQFYVIRFDNRATQPPLPWPLSPQNRGRNGRDASSVPLETIRQVFMYTFQM